MRKLTNREKRLLVLLSIALMIIVCERWYRRWSHDIVLESKNYIAYSTATKDDTQLALDKAEILYAAYNEFMSPVLAAKKNGHKLKLKLYKDRDEFKRSNRAGWAEAMYRKPYCHQYIDTSEKSPYHWMVHEATHQLNRELAGLKLSNWINEGLACYFSTSLLGEDEIQLGKIDEETYPIWWIATLDISGDMEKDIQSKKIIPLDLIVRDKTGPSMRKHFNTYYIHWWSVTHFCIHYNDGQYKDGFFKVIKDGGTKKSFEKHIGPIKDIQKKWYQYLQKIAKDI